MGKKGGSNREAAAARADEAARQQRIREGTKSIDDTFSSNFNDDFYAGRRQSYLDYANPQLDKQYEDATKQLTYALARGGTMNSSIRAQKFGELQQLYDRNKQQVTDQALGYENSARTGAEDARANLIATLNATGDAEGAANSALTRAATLSKPETYSPLANLFADFTSGLGVQAAQERAEALSGGSYKPRYNTGLFGTTGTVKVT